MIKAVNSEDLWSLNVTSKIDITISSDLDYENLIADVVVNGKFFGLITNEPSKGLCYEAPEGQVSSEPIELDILIAALNEAKRQLLK